MEDLELLSTVFGIKDDEVARPLSNGVKGLKIAFLKTIVWSNAGPGTQKAWEDGKKSLKDAGSEVEDIDFPAEFAKLADWHTCVLFCDGRVAFRPEYMTQKDKLDSFLIDHVEEKHGYTRKQYVEAFDGISSLRPKWDAIAEQYDAVVVPSVPDEAPEGLESTGSAVFQGIWTALHAPIINIPGFRGENGMPVGLSLTTGRYKDLALLNVAKEVAKVWVKDG